MTWNVELQVNVLKIKLMERDVIERDVIERDVIERDVKKGCTFYQGRSGGWRAEDMERNANIDST